MLAFARTLVRPITVCRRTLSVLNVQGARKPAEPKKAAPAGKPTPAKKPEKASRAPSAFNLFAKVAWDKVKKENPGLKFAEGSAMVRKAWADASAEAKAPFEKEAEILKAEVAAKRAVEIAKKKEAARPPSAYILFSNKIRSSVVAENPNKPMPEIAKLMGAAWKQLPVEEQQKYKDEAKGLLDAWKAKQPPAA